MEPEDFVVASSDGRVVADAAARDRVVELAGLYDVCRAAFFETANRFHWRPAAGSSAAALAEALPSPDPALARTRPETGNRLIAGVVQTYLLTAAGHLGGLSGLHTTGEVMFSPGMLVRGVIECSARAMWVLGIHEDAPEQLLARAYLEELLSAEEAKKASGRLQGKGTKIYREHERTYRDLKAEIVDRFAGASPKELGEGVLHGEKLVKPQAAVTWMYELLERHAGSTVTSEASLGIYDYLSNVTHPTLYPTRQLREWVELSDHPGEATAQLRIEVDFLERQAAAAVIAFYNALSYVISYFGWSRDVHDQLTAEIDRVLPGTLRDPG